MTDLSTPFHDHPLWHKRTRLANGAEVPLRAAARWYGALELLLGADLEWDPLPLLRECAFGRPVDRSQAAVLVREGLLRPDGGMDPALREVTLAAVRGEGRHLSLASPFTDPLDRAVAQYDHARQLIRLHMPPHEAEAFLRSDPAQSALDILAAGPPSPVGDGDLPPSVRDTKGFVDRLLKKTRPAADGPPPPPPSG